MLFGRIGPWELVLILMILMLIFGAKRLPEMGQAIGQTIRELRKTSEAKDEGDKTDESA